MKSQSIQTRELVFIHYIILKIKNSGSVHHEYFLNLLV